MPPNEGWTDGPAGGSVRPMKSKLTETLWAPRPPEETRALYAEWAAAYDDDLTEAGYPTPGRLARALAAEMPDRAAPVLDFGCGTGLSGLALRAAGFGAIDGTDITPEMLERAAATGVYRKTWLGEPGTMGAVKPGDYAAIGAAGVVSLGAAPPETLAMLLDALAPGGLLAFSYNDSTLAADGYIAAHRAAPTPAEEISAASGPHVVSNSMGDNAFVLPLS